MICGCGNKILFNQKYCPHCKKPNGEYNKWGFDEYLFVFVIFAAFAGIAAACAMHYRPNGRVIFVSVLCLPIFIISVAEMIGRTADKFRSITRSPKKCRHKFKLFDCWCFLCGLLRAEGHDWDENGCECLHCGHENHEWEIGGYG
jgi:hypothetical protein